MMSFYFSDWFQVDPSVIEKYGAFNICLAFDLPLFIDPFLLFQSDKPVYRALHDSMIRYLSFLHDKSEGGSLDPGLIRAWYHFREVKQTWLGFCEDGNAGRGLGARFATALHSNLQSVFRDFGDEHITKGKHLEKLCLLGVGVGRDMISDLTTNLVKSYLLEYSQAFAIEHLDAKFVRRVPVDRAFFDYERERWTHKAFQLPWAGDDYVLLTPIDLLTKDETWISPSDMRNRFEDIPKAIASQQLRAEISNYLKQQLVASRKAGARHARKEAVEATIRAYPQLIEHYIRMQEEAGDQAVVRSRDHVAASVQSYCQAPAEFSRALAQCTDFYRLQGNTIFEVRQRVRWFKEMIEDRGLHRLLWRANEPVSEADIQLMFRLVWFGTPSDITPEANDGRGPADFKVSRGSVDKSLIEFKLASNSRLRSNLEKQVEIYRRASDAEHGVKVILFFTNAEEASLRRTLRSLRLESAPDIVLIDGRRDNKPSGSKA